MKDKSDKNAKEAFTAELLRRGFSDIKVTKAPADIIAYKAGEKFYFEIKKTSAENEYFGAATLTEWRAAYANLNNYFFVICRENDNVFSFIEYTPEEFEHFSSIPPFKIFFNIPLNGAEKVLLKRANKTAVRLTSERLNKLDELYHLFKNDRPHKE